jgi:hypothetical protein
MQIKDCLRIVYGLLAGSLLYIPLVLLPLAGPLYAGIFAGKKAGTMPVAGFFVGAASAAIGYLFWVYAIFPFFNIRTEDLISGIFWMLFLGWNIFCAILAGIGGMMGSILSYSKKMRSEYNGKDRKKGPMETEESRAPETTAPTFIICAGCGTSNQEDSTHCKNCGKDIR